MFVATVVAVYALKWGESILVPLVLALLLMDLLSPLADRMRAWRIPDCRRRQRHHPRRCSDHTRRSGCRIAAGLFAHRRPADYRDNLIAKVHALRGSGGTPIGLILALPITVWLVSVGRYFPGLPTLSMLLSAEQLDDEKPPGAG